MSGKYYWLKLPKDFFNSHKVKILEGMPDGKEMVLLYLKLLAESIGHNGSIRYSDEIPYTPEMLASLTGTELTIVNQTLKNLTSLHLLKKAKDGTLILTEMDKYIGFESEWAKYKRSYREKKTDENTQGKLDNVQEKLDNVQSMSNKCPMNVQEKLDNVQPKLDNVQSMSNENWTMSNECPMDVQEKLDNVQTMSSENWTMSNKRKEIRDKSLDFLKEKYKRESGLDDRTLDYFFEFLSQNNYLPSDIDTLLSHLQGLSRGDNALAYQIIDQSFKKAWRGFYEIKPKSKKGKKNEWDELGERLKEELDGQIGDL